MGSHTFTVVLPLTVAFSTVVSFVPSVLTHRLEFEEVQPPGTIPDVCQAPWERFYPPEHHDSIQTVHIVSMTHLDVGGWGPSNPECDDSCRYAHDVCDTYFEHYIPIAAKTATNMNRSHSKEPKFIYSTHPWILQEYFNASAGCGSTVRNLTEVAEVAAAIRSGSVSWHAKPFTMIHELCDPDIFLSALKISRNLNQRFGTNNGVISAKISDLPGVSIGIVPLFAKAGVKVLHIGTNGMGDQAFTSFPGVGNLPQIFQWQHPTTGDVVVVMNEQGYGRQIVPNVDTGITDALRWQFTGDNLTPPTPAMIADCWNYSHAEFPNAILKASTLDAYGEVLWAARDKLPIVKKEIGNAWLTQMGTDPWRLRALRGVSRLRAEWISDGKITAADPDLLAYESRLLVPIEHNFGMALSKVINASLHTNYWTNDEFHKHKAAYAGMEEYSDERDTFLWPLPTRNTSSDAFQAFAKKANETLMNLRIITPLDELLKKGGASLIELNLDDAGALRLENANLMLTVDRVTGAIDSLVEKANNRDWAAGNKSLGTFVYRTYTQQHDITPYIKQFTPTAPINDTAGMQWWPWNKAGMDDSIERDLKMPSLDQVSRAWAVTLTRAWRTTNNDSTTPHSLLLQLRLPDQAVQLFGGASQIILNITLPIVTSGVHTDEVEMTLSWVNKTATRLAESTWFSFDPAVAEPDKGWRLDVLGTPLDPLSVTINGSRHFHAVHRGVCYDDTTSRTDKNGQRLALESLDAPLLAPGDTSHLLNFDNQLPDLTGGMHFNLHNNAGWDASAPWWYGDDAMFRFRVRLNPLTKGCW